MKIQHSSGMHAARGFAVSNSSLHTAIQTLLTEQLVV